MISKHTHTHVILANHGSEEQSGMSLNDDVALICALFEEEMALTTKPWTTKFLKRQFIPWSIYHYSPQTTTTVLLGVAITYIPMPPLPVSWSSKLHHLSCSNGPPR